MFLDIKMPGMDGLEVLQRLRHLVEVTPSWSSPATATVSTAVEATKLGAFDFIEKPLERERVLVTVRNAVDTRRLRTENRRSGATPRSDIRSSATRRSWRACASRSTRRRRPTPPC